MAQDVTVRWEGAKATAAARRGGIAGLHVGTQLILGEAVKIVPLDEATLQDSGKASVDEEELTGIVSFDTPYAVVQHEDLTLHHPNGRQAKYLETPWRDNAERVQEIIAEEIRKALA